MVTAKSAALGASPASTKPALASERAPAESMALGDTGAFDQRQAARTSAGMPSTRHRSQARTRRERVLNQRHPAAARAERQAVQCG